MKDYQLTGGAKIGIVNATFPFAKLKVNKNKLELNISLVGIKYLFQPQDILSIEIYMLFPLIGQGIKINHIVKNYNKKVIFWTFKSPKSVIQNIEKIGFLAKKINHK